MLTGGKQQGIEAKLNRSAVFIQKWKSCNAAARGRKPHPGSFEKSGKIYKQSCFGVVHVLKWWPLYDGSVFLNFPSRCMKRKHRRPKHANLIAKYIWQSWRLMKCWLCFVTNYGHWLHRCSLSKAMAFWKIYRAVNSNQFLRTAIHAHLCLSAIVLEYVCFAWTFFSRNFTKLISPGAWTSTDLVKLYFLVHADFTSLLFERNCGKQSNILPWRS